MSSSSSCNKRVPQRMPTGHSRFHKLSQKKNTRRCCCVGAQTRDCSWRNADSRSSASSWDASRLSLACSPTSTCWSCDNWQTQAHQYIFMRHTCIGDKKLSCCCDGRSYCELATAHYSFPTEKFTQVCAEWVSNNINKTVFCKIPEHIYSNYRLNVKCRRLNNMCWTSQQLRGVT